jgi:hypothetical protein
MQKKILFIEDKYCDYELLHEGLSQRYACYPHINGTSDEFEKFLELFSDYLDTPTNAIETKLVNYIIGINPDIFIVDIALFEEGVGNRLDFSGGILRQEFLAKHFPRTPAVILTQYLDHEVNQFMQVRDVHVYKYEFKGAYPNPAIIRHLSGIFESFTHW